MPNFKSKSFFVKSAIIHIFFILVAVIASWQFLEPVAYNIMHNSFTANKVGSDDIVLIVIDDKSIERYRWPWQRDLYAKIFTYLNEYSKPKIIGFDAIVSSLDNENPQKDAELFSVLRKYNNIVVGFAPVAKDYSNDVSEKYDKSFAEKFKVNLDLNNVNLTNDKYKSLTHYPKPYFNALKYAGHVNIETDNNGDIIYSDQVLAVNNNYYPLLALKMYMLLNNSNKLILNNEYLTAENTNLKIPVSNLYHNQLTYDTYSLKAKTHYYKLRDNSEYSHKKYSAIDVIDSFENIKNGKAPVIDPAEFDNKIVFVGGNAKATAMGLLDVFKTPVSASHPGVDINATNLNNMLDNQFITETTIVQDLLIIIFMTIVTFVIILNFKFFASLMILILLAIAYLGFVIVCFKHNISPNIATPLVVELFTMIFGYSYRFILEGKNKEKIKQAMGKYLSQDIMQNVVQNIDDIKLGGKKAVVTVLFADIRGFTRISEELSAEEVSVILNEYFTAIEPVISKYNGVINKFIGDAVMAIFGEPIQDENHAKNAVLCANEMLRTVDILRDKWLFEGKPNIEIGIGINTGEAFVGNIGSEKRLEYTVIGDTVNLASRIEGYNKVYKTNLLISNSTYQYVGDIADVIKISEVSIRGKSKKLDIYEVLRLI